MTLTEFITARLDEDEAVAKAAQADAWSETAGIHGFEDPWPSHFAFAEHLTPARVLADVAAKRAIVELHTGDHECVGIKYGKQDCVYVHPDFVFRNDPTLCLMALPYADHEGFREEWRP